MAIVNDIELPGMNCGLCGFKTCDDFALKAAGSPELMKRCIHLSDSLISAKKEAVEVQTAPSPCASCGSSECRTSQVADTKPWQDSLGREFDFYLEHFPEDPGPREIIIPHNPMITREMELAVGDVIIGRPLGMSCGCPITHCGVITNVEMRTGVVTWCVTGPLAPRAQGFKDIGYYIAEAYEGIVRDTRVDLRIGLRYYFQPRMCMLQWRHSGLINYLNRIPQGYQVRLEGLFIG